MRGALNRFVLSLCALVFVFLVPGCARVSAELADRQGRSDAEAVISEGHFFIVWNDEPTNHEYPIVARPRPAKECTVFVRLPWHCRVENETVRCYDSEFLADPNTDGLQWDVAPYETILDWRDRLPEDRTATSVGLVACPPAAKVAVSVVKLSTEKREAYWVAFNETIVQSNLESIMAAANGS